MLKIAVDIDGVISEYPEFFRAFSESFKGKAKIYILTNRDPNSYEDTAEELSSYGIVFDELKITADKAWWGSLDEITHPLIHERIRHKNRKRTANCCD